MPRHTFRFPPHIQSAVKSHVVRAYSDIDARRFAQESPYVTALAANLEGYAYDGRDGIVRFTSTIVNDRGRNSAEKRYGADLAITAYIENSDQIVSKAILVQAKRGNVSELSNTGIDDLVEQIDKMKRVTRSPKVMEIHEITQNLRIPHIISGNLFFNDEPYKPQALESYFTSRILTTLDGDTRPRFVNAVQDSALTQVGVIARID